MQHGRRRRPSGDWLARNAIPDQQHLDLASLGLSTAEPEIDARVCGSVLSSLLQDRPPSFAEAQQQVENSLARWEVSSEASTRVASGGQSSRRPGSGGNPVIAGSSSNAGSCCGLRSKSASRADSSSPAGRSNPLGARPPLPRPLVSAGAALATSAVPAVAQDGSWSDRSEVLSSRLPRGGEEGSLVTSLAARLAQVEQLNRQLTTKVAEQSNEIDQLKTQLQDCQRSSADSVAAVDASSDSDALRAECERLKRQVMGMTEFIKSYGLNWVPARESVNEPLQVDIGVLKSRVESLNAAVGEERSNIVIQESRGGIACAGLASATAVELPLTFFQDGLKLADHAFLQFDCRPAQDVIRDILDGYFPRTLKDEYPHAVPLRIVDRTSHPFKIWLRDLACKDPDLANGGESLRPAVGHAYKAPRDKQSAGERLVAKLPERVIRQGRVCEVRNAIAEKLGICSGTSRSSSEPPKKTSDSSGEVSLLRSGREASNGVARLQVKLEGGQKVLLKMEPTATIGSLWEALAKWRRENGVPRAEPSCVLRTAFPPRSYVNMDETLEAAGLTPSATLFVSANSEPHG